LAPSGLVFAPLMHRFYGNLKADGWRGRYGIERLREALDDIAEALELIHQGVTP